MSKMIYKICSQQEWDVAVGAGQFDGSSVDVADGFIHFSAAEQVAATAAKHFAGRADLVLVCVEAESLGDSLKWEVSRGGDLFPHLYSPLSTDHAQSVVPLPLGEDGLHVFQF